MSVTVIGDAVSAGCIAGGLKGAQRVEGDELAYQLAADFLRGKG